MATTMTAPTIDPVKLPNVTNATSATYKAPTLPGANLQTVDSKQTMQGQLQDILSKNNPLMQQAQTRALQGMNRRGLVNSSMAAGAAQSAMVDAAMPIAQFDATRYSDVGNRNQDVSNQFKLTQYGADLGAAKDNAGFQQQTNLTNAAAQNQASLVGAEMTNQRALQQAGFKADASKFNAGSANEEAAQIRGIQSQERMQTQQLTAQEKNLLSELASRERMNSASLSAQEKNLLAELRSREGMQTQQLSAQEKNLLAELKSKAALQTQQLTAQEKNLLSELTSRGTLLKFEYGERAKMQTEALKAEAERLKSQLDSAEDIEANRLTNEITKIEKQITSQEIIANLDADTREALADIEAEYKTTMQINASALDFYQQAIKSIADLENNPDITDTTAGKNAIYTELENAFTIISQLNDPITTFADFAKLIDFNNDGE